MIKPEYAALVAYLEQLQKHDPLSLVWRRYVDLTRLWLYERESGQGGFVGGMSVMLVFPKVSRGDELWSSGFTAWPDLVNALGVPLLVDGVDAPTIHYLDFNKASVECMSDLGRPLLLMSRPSWIPAWTIYPTTGLSRGWNFLMADSGSRGSSLFDWLIQIAKVQIAKLMAYVEPASFRLHCVGPVDLNGFASALATLELELVWFMIRRFLKHLNQTVSGACLFHRGSVRPEEYNWVVSAKSANSWEWRLDALRTFPAISVSAVAPSFAVQVSPSQAKRSHTLRELAKWAKNPPVAGTDAFSEVVDKGLPMIKSLAATFGVRPVAIRAIHGIGSHVDQLFAKPPLGWGDLFLTLNAIAPERHPKTLEEWVAFSILYHECIRLFNSVQSLHATLAQRFLVKIARPWMALRSKNWERSEALWRDGLGNSADLEKSLTVALEVRSIVDELGLSSSERYEAFGKIAAMTPEKWRTVMHKLSNPEEDNAAAWHSVRHSGLIEGIPVRAINSSKLLFDEGKHMRHCIYTHRERLQTERQLAFSIGIDGDRDRSTIQIAYRPHEEDGWETSIVEHRAKFNHTPSYLCQTVARRLCADLESPSFESVLREANLARVRRCEERTRHALLASARSANLVEQRAVSNGLDLTEMRDLLLNILTASSPSKS
jgi:hypothetical protein